MQPLNLPVELDGVLGVFTRCDENQGIRVPFQAGAGLLDGADRVDGNPIQSEAASPHFAQFLVAVN